MLFDEGSALLPAPGSMSDSSGVGYHFQAVHSHLEPGCFVRLAFGLVSSSFPRSSQCPTPLGKLKPHLVKKLQGREMPDLGARCVCGVLILAMVPNGDSESIDHGRLKERHRWRENLWCIKDCLFIKPDAFRVCG